MVQRFAFRRGLVLNVGSSTLKWSVLDGGAGSIVGGATVPWERSGGADPIARIASAAGDVDVVGHRIVHGGTRFVRPVRVDDAVRLELAALVALDPLHMTPALEALDAARRALPSAVHVAAFDTAFHASMPAEARTYAVPEAWTAALGVRRYGFHGLSVAHAMERTADLIGSPRRVVVAHLGSGASVTAVRDGGSVDTTMGMTPLEGLVMATRSGSIDPSIILFAQERLGLDAAACADALAHRSGMLALSGTSGDWREVRRAAASGQARAQLACRVFTLSVVRATGAMIASAGGCDALVFTGGIGEHDAGLRRDVVASLAFAGARLDDAANERRTGDRRIDTLASAVRVLVIEAREDLAIARAMSELVRVA